MICMVFINVLCDVLDKLILIEIFLYDFVFEIGERIKDKKSGVRKTALKCLCIVYCVYV